jgi:hypothetical protein
VPEQPPAVDVVEHEAATDSPEQNSALASPAAE